MKEAFIVSGRLTDDRTVVLDEPMPVSDKPVKLVIEVNPGVTPGKGTMADAMALIRERQRARGHVPMTTEQIDALWASVYGHPTQDDEE